jgi:hypothetical protein
MEWLTAASALEVKMRLRDVYTDYQILLSELVILDRQEQWDEFGIHFEAISRGLDQFDRFQVGTLLRAVEALTKCYERGFATRDPGTDRDDIRRRAIQFFAQFRQFVRLDPPSRT